MFGRDPEKTAQTAARFGFASSTDTDTAFEDPSYDLVDICLPPPCTPHTCCAPWTRAARTGRTAPGRRHQGRRAGRRRGRAQRQAGVRRHVREVHPGRPGPAGRGLRGHLRAAGTADPVERDRPAVAGSLARAEGTAPGGHAQRHGPHHANARPTPGHRRDHPHTRRGRRHPRSHLQLRRRTPRPATATGRPPPPSTDQQDSRRPTCSAPRCSRPHPKRTSDAYAPQRTAPRSVRARPMGRTSACRPPPKAVRRSPFAVRAAPTDTWLKRNCRAVEELS